ncbi:MAG: AcrB/AcrD/AcrF family protein, partial [Acidobacteria bacterium CG_4_9_14_3_um_filter_49_7]
MKITEFSVRRRLATSAVVLVLVVVGLYGLWRLPVDFLPDVTYPMIKVHIWWRGATPEEIDKNLADPIEREMATVDDLDYLESSSIEGMYTLLANFKYGVDVNVAYQDALAAMARVARELPREIEPPVIIKADPSQLPVVQLTVSNDNWDLVQLRTWAEDWLQDRLTSVPGVAGSEIVGGLKREIRIHLDPRALEKHKLTLGDVSRRIREENQEGFAGRVIEGEKEIIARTLGEYQDLDEIRNVVLKQENGTSLYLRDVAEILDGHEETRVITRLNGKPCVKLSILKQASANTVEVAAGVEQKIEELRPVLPAGMQLGMVENQGIYVENALHGVQNTAVEAAVLLIFIVYLFLGSWRQVLVILIALPLTLAINFGLMKFGDFSLNIFSLGGLVIALGILLDNSILVIENVTRHMRFDSGREVSDIAVEATDELGPALVAATFSFLALFVPFLLVPGLTSLLFRELILVIAGIVLISLVMAVSVTPMITTLLLKREPTGQRHLTRFERFFERVSGGYERSLLFAIRHRWLVIIGFMVVFLLAWGGLKSVGSEFLPKMDDGRIMIKVKLPTGTSVQETNRVLREAEKILADDPLIESAFTLAGGKVWGLYTYEISNEGEIDIQLVPRRARDITTAEYIRKIRPKMAGLHVPGGKIMVMQMKVKGIRKIGEADIEVEIKGQEVKTLFELAGQTSAAMSRLRHFKNVYVSMDMTKPEYQLKVDRTKAAELGVSVSDLADTLNSLVSGLVVTRFRDRDEYYNIRIMIPEEKIVSARDLENLGISTTREAYVLVKDVATARRALGPVEIVRQDQTKQVVVRGDALGVSIGVALSELKDALAKMTLPPGYSIEFGGQAQMMREMKTNLSAVLLFALFFSFVVLAVQFNSMKIPTLILGSVPFCLAGVVFFLKATGLPLGAT